MGNVLCGAFHFTAALAIQFVKQLTRYYLQSTSLYVTGSPIEADFIGQRSI